MSILSGQWPRDENVESLRLEKTTKIIQFNCQIITTVLTEPCLSVPHLSSSWKAPGMVGDSTTSLDGLFQHTTTLSEKNFFLISNLNLSWCNLRPLLLVLSVVTWKRGWCLTSWKGGWKDVAKGNIRRGITVTVTVKIKVNLALMEWPSSRSSRTQPFSPTSSQIWNSMLLLKKKQKLARK